MDLAAAPTPALVLDRPRLERNCARMLARCRALGVKLRPHLKTLKAGEAARLAIDPDHGGIAVSTLAEAEYFAARGVDDIQYAVCITPDKLARAAGLARRIPRFSFFLDSVEMARAAGVQARDSGTKLRAWIEIDSGAHRTGVGPGDPRLSEIAGALSDGGVILEGVATHAGHSYEARDADAMMRIAEEEREAILTAAAHLRREGFDVPGASAGSTPTAVRAVSGEGLTELRAGVYMAGDLFQSGLGTLAEEDIAVSVLASVISQDRARNQVVIDAGGLALSKDRSTAALPGGDMGYGLVLDVEGRSGFGRLTVAGVHQEHGEIVGTAPLPFDRLPIGTRVRILPNHVCMTAAAHDRYVVVDGGTAIVAEWDKAGGW